MNRYAWILTSFCLAKARAWIETKEMGTGQWSKQEQLILAQGVDSKNGQLIYLTWKGSFQVILYKMIRFLSGKLKKHMKLAKIAFLLTNWSFLWTSINLTDFSHPMTVKPSNSNLKSKLSVQNFNFRWWGWLGLIGWTGGRAYGAE